jgi:uncharacterized repeat protein (TIGR03803 family)
MSKFREGRIRVKSLAACLILQMGAIAIVGRAFAQPYAEITVHSFIPAPYGQNPVSSLIQASDGNLYGTAYAGGATGHGTVFRIGNLSGTPTETVIFNFTGGADGSYPEAALIQAADGNLYGTASFGGSGGFGTVFRINNPGGTPTVSVIHSFTNGADGGFPDASLIQASDGNLYGTASVGGANAYYGTIFRIADLGGTPTFSVIYSFAGGADGAYPHASLIQASDGSLYGTTPSAATSGYGTVFAIGNLAGTPTFHVIYSFMGGADGDYPSAALIQASDGNLYGTTAYGGTSYVGTVFRITNLAGTPTESVIYSFTRGADGAYPSASLIQASDGNLYGTTEGGYAAGSGTVFRMSNLGGTPTFGLIYGFAGGADGGFPSASLIQATDGDLYGTTFQGGTSTYGTIFAVGNLTGSPTFGVVYNFTGVDAKSSSAALLQASDGNLYGTTALGGTNDAGAIFRVGNLSGTPTEGVLYSFSGGADGGQPFASLIEASDGNLYGTTRMGGTSGYGTVFEVSSFAGTPSLTVLYSFTGGSDGGYPNAALLQASDGNLYGTTVGGFPIGPGSVFRISNLGGTPTFSVIYSFTGGPDGGYSRASLIQASDGNLYGTTSHGGVGDFGTVFKISNLAGTPTESVIYSFLGGVDGEFPEAALVQASDGKLYGTAPDAGKTGNGVVFSVGNLADAPIFSVVYAFGGGVDGSTPSASLIQASDGDLYGTTFQGGASGNCTDGCGTVFAITNLAGTPTESVLYRFTGGADGSFPFASLIQASDGNLYGTTAGGGIVDGAGAVFAMVKPCFNDVPVNNPFRTFICTIARDGITAGCGGGNFCPSSSVLRSQMAVFLLRGEHGSSYAPPAATGIFSDVLASDPFAPWIEELYNEGITGGCGTNPLVYCPSNPVTRASMAVFLLRAKNGPAYTPPACSGIFTDVACPSPFADWIEALYAAGITGGCGTNPLTYCPAEPVTRAQMAVFLVATFNLQ